MIIFIAYPSLTHTVKVWLTKTSVIHTTKYVFYFKHPSVCTCKYKVWQGKIMRFFSQKLTVSFEKLVHKLFRYLINMCSVEETSL